MSKAGVSADRLGYILNAEEETEPENAEEPDMHGDICFEHVNFAYEGLHPVLKDVDFTIKRARHLLFWVGLVPENPRLPIFWIGSTIYRRVAAVSRWRRGY